MSRVDDFCRLCGELEQAGFDLEDARYQAKQFGSWYVKLARKGMRSRQISLDGRDGLMIVRVKGAAGKWTDDWHSFDAAEQSPEAIIARLD